MDDQTESWIIEDWPSCQFHVFLSHVREDTETLVKPLAARLEELGVIVWGDWKHFGSPRDSLRLLRDKILRSRHVVYLITQNAMRQGRGWLAAERAYGSLMQSTLMVGDLPLLDVELLLLTLPKTNADVSQSVWQPLLNQSNAVSVIRQSNSETIAECCSRIVSLVRHVEQNGPGILGLVQDDPMLRYRLRLCPELEDRLTGISPSILPRLSR